MGTLEGRVAVVTGAGQGIGREHALLFAAEGASVVVNDSSRFNEDTSADGARLGEVVEEIIARGGRAVANDDDVTDWAGARRIVDCAVDTFGDLHVLVNNTTLLRDRMLVNMSERDWDDVVAAHLKGHFGPTRHAAEYWRDQQRAGREARRAVVNTSSTSGLFGAVGQSNYGAAKMGIAGLTIIAAQELTRYGVRVNAIAPGALSGLPAQLVMTDGTGVDAGSDHQPYDLASVSPFVAYLGTDHCPINGRVFLVVAGEVHLFQPWTLVDNVMKEGRWTVEELAVHAARFAEAPVSSGVDRLLFETEPSN